MKTLIASAALFAVAVSTPVAARDSFMPWASAHWEVSDFESRTGAVRVEIRDSAFAPWLSPGEVTVDSAKASAGTQQAVAGFSPWG